MLSFFNLNSFKIFNIFLIFIFSVVVNNNLNPLLSLSFYCIFYLFIIYLGIYYFNKYLFIIFFFYGLFLDILLLNEIGPHLIVFILALFLLNISVKFLYNLSSFKVYCLIIFLQILMIFLQMIISYILFNVNFDSMHFMQIIFLTLILSYPIFLFFSKIDKYN